MLNWLDALMARRLMPSTSEAGGCELELLARTQVIRLLCRVTSQLCNPELSSRCCSFAHCIISNVKNFAA